ncbi:hypothetical protein LEP1GSC185_3901 [Leptospira licerasiae serovar Varillal str. VAR 010]|uniref:Uncharacterized protein n=1 Tax=Leptospira licerasiae str. MMD4847 TaxID=1049971 RepID=A0ABN0H9X0_9LEPT|nr:hypothetical protein LEP1GSC185_3901 [Leptospira licerasiae serovar Varillal str. VAR 010]EJZ42325.1 hypothetical protein LEP1GSC178_0067 [Leptospira licerasiae str. MMD4847]
MVIPLLGSGFSFLGLPFVTDFFFLALTTFALKETILIFILTIIILALSTINFHFSSAILFQSLDAKIFYFHKKVLVLK